MPSGPTIILSLKIAVTAVTLILVAAMVALARGNYRLHGRLNVLFSVLTITAVVVFEVLIHSGADVTSHMNDAERAALQVHLGFALLAPFAMVAMLLTGLTHRRRIHIRVAVLFTILWLGTWITGVFFLPHSPR